MRRRGHYPNQPQAPQELEHLQNMMHLNINIDHFSTIRNDDHGNHDVYDHLGNNDAIGNLLVSVTNVIMVIMIMAKMMVVMIKSR